MFSPLSSYDTSHMTDQSMVKQFHAQPIQRYSSTFRPSQWQDLTLPCHVTCVCVLHLSSVCVALGSDCVIHSACVWGNWTPWSTVIAGFKKFQQLQSDSVSQQTVHSWALTGRDLGLSGLSLNKKVHTGLHKESPLECTCSFTFSTANLLSSVELTSQRHWPQKNIGIDKYGNSN